MDNRRMQRVEREIHQIVSEYMLSHLKVPLSGMLSVSRVSIAPDLKSGKVYITELLKNNSVEEDIEILNDWAPYFQKEISNKLRLKYCPKLKFVQDPGYDNMLKVDKILSDLKNAN